MITIPLHTCFAEQSSFADRAHELAKRLAYVAQDESDLLRLGASCVRIAAHNALQAREDREAVRAWSECELGDRQIRFATYGALRRGCIANADYDATLASAFRAARARREEMLRLRQRLRLLAIV